MEIHTEVKSELNKTLLLHLCSGHYGSRLSDTDATDESDKRSAACCYTR